MTGKAFPPTELDLALARDPVAGAVNRDLVAATTDQDEKRGTGDDTLSFVRGDKPPKPASRQGQTEIAAASLAAGMIAAEGHPVTAAEAVQRVRDVLDELNTV